MNWHKCVRCRKVSPRVDGVWECLHDECRGPAYHMRLEPEPRGVGVWKSGQKVRMLPAADRPKAKGWKRIA